MTSQLKLYPDAANRFIRESGRLHGKKSESTYRTHLRLLQGQHPYQALANFSHKDLHAFCFGPNGHTGLPAAAATIRVRKAILTSFFKWAKFEELVPADPAVALSITVDVKPVPERVNTWLSMDQIRDLLLNEPTAMPTGGTMERRDRVMVYMGLFTGLRLASMVGLRWSSLTSRGTIGFKGKGRKLSEVNIGPVLGPVLSAWRAECQPNQTGDGPIFPTFKSPGCLFKGEEMLCYWDRPLGEGGARDAVAKAGLRIGVPLRPHDLRRSFTTVLRDQKVDLLTMSWMMCHESVATTERYMKMNPHEVFERAEQVCPTGF